MAVLVAPATQQPRIDARVGWSNLCKISRDTCMSTHPIMCVNASTFIRTTPGKRMHSHVCMPVYDKTYLVRLALSIAVPVASATQRPKVDARVGWSNLFNISRDMCVSTHPIVYVHASTFIRTNARYTGVFTCICLDLPGASSNPDSGSGRTCDTATND